MVDFSSVINSVGSGANSTVTWVLIVVGIIVGVILLAGGIFLWWFTKKRYNLRVEIKMTRSDGKISLGEWGKGLFNISKGVLYIKRAKMKAVPIRVIDIRRYLQGSDLITVLQVGPEDYRPVINDSWTEQIVEFEDDKGKIVEIKESVLNIKADSGLNKPWKSAWESASKKAYSLSSVLQQYATPISIGIVIIAVFVGFAIIWTRLPTICK
jgi:hypothetical protein